MVYSHQNSFPLDPYEEVLCIKVMSLEISEYTHERRSLIVVGTAILRGDDLTAQGRIYVFDIIEVVPEPGHPETGYKLKQLAKEEVKGAVTALSEVGTEGFLLAAQGQKVLARGLKEDGTLLPVAFMDAQCYLTVVKELKGTGLCIFGDAVQGVQFAGYMVRFFPQFTPSFHPRNSFLLCRKIPIKSKPLAAARRPSK